MPLLQRRPACSPGLTFQLDTMAPLYSTSMLHTTSLTISRATTKPILLTSVSHRSSHNFKIQLITKWQLTIRWYRLQFRPARYRTSSSSFSMNGTSRRRPGLILTSQLQDCTKWPTTIMGPTTHQGPKRVNHRNNNNSSRSITANITVNTITKPISLSLVTRRDPLASLVSTVAHHSLR